MLILLLIVGVVFGLASCRGDDDDEPEAKVYNLDSSAFNSTAVFGENLSLRGLKLVEAGGETVDVTSDMVSGIDTKTAGAKKLTIFYNDQTFEVNYTVKFRVIYVVNDVETAQLVSNVGEIVVPETPEILGKQFDRWSVDLPATLTSNLRIDAIYKTLSVEREDAYTWTGEGVINLSGYANAGTAIGCTVTDADGNPLSGIASVDSASGKLNYSLGDNDVIIVSINGEGVLAKSWKVQKVEKPSVSISDSAVGIVLGSNRKSQKIDVSSTPVSFKYVTTPSNENILTAASNGYLFIDVLKAGVTALSIKAVNATNELESIELTQYVVVAPKTGTFTIANLKTEYGIENIWTVARENAAKLAKLTATGGDAANIGAGFFDNITWVTNNANVTVSGGVITLADIAQDPDIVEIKAVFGFGGVTFESAPMKVRCVYDGINVYSYEELYSETVKADPRPIVLQANIKDDFSSTNYTWMKSTYDLDYYKNTGATEQDMKIKVLMQFKNDVYGNGFEINAHNATIGTLDATGQPVKGKTLFWGPLNFVKMAQGRGAISVKGQDNIVFGVYDGVTLNNIILKSCDLTAVDGKIDLTDLDYAGTTVEVLGDNVTIEYSRLMNGRTVLRVFGDDKDATKQINVEVKNTILKASREFTARLGSNRFVSDSSTPSPKLPGDTGSEYNAKTIYANKEGDPAGWMTADQKAAYDAKFINTYVTFENCVFEDAGIFSIGLDSHFAGGALHDGSEWLNGALVGWNGLAKTSYGVKLTFKDDVRLYSWKPLEDIDSSTLIENNLTANDTGNEFFLNLTFNVKVLVENASKLENYSSILDNVNGVNYVHSGIAFFGGGKNYSVFENLINEFHADFSTYEVKLEDLTDGIRDQSYLANAAGDEPFYFFIYSATNTFTYEEQQALENKYDVLRK